MRTTARWKSRVVVGQHITYQWILRCPTYAAAAWCGARAAAFAGGFYRALDPAGILLHGAVALGDRPEDDEPKNGSVLASGCFAPLRKDPSAGARGGRRS